MTTAENSEVQNLIDKLNDIEQVKRNPELQQKIDEVSDLSDTLEENTQD